MRLVFLLIAGLIAPGCPAADLPELYSRYGKLLITNLATAPFPHPARAEGHRYKDWFFPADQHYTDSTVAIFVPRNFRSSEKAEFLVHFHGWQNNVEHVLARYKLIEQLVESGRNAVLVVPQGPKNASDSFGGKLEDEGGFKRFMDEVEQTIASTKLVSGPAIRLPKIIVSGHSGGYHVMAAILDRGGIPERVSEVYLFDALYGETDKFVKWQKQQSGRLLNIYTPDGGTKGESEHLAQIEAANQQSWHGPEADVNPGVLGTNKVIIISSALAHDDVVHLHKTLETFLRSE